MMGDLLRGIFLVIFIVCLAGAIAYVGDRVGHQVGRKRLTLFGIRPRYTSTIVAIGTGMLIALVVVVGALLANSNVKTAFFHLNAVNSRVTQLQAQADLLENRVRKQQEIVGVGDLMNDRHVVLPPNATFDQRYKAFRAFYDDTNDYVNRTYIPAGLRKNTTPRAEVEKRLREFVQDYRLSAMLSLGPVLLLATADQNLFANDEAHFSITPFPDRLAFARGQDISAIIVQANPKLDLQFELYRLRQQVSQEAFGNGIPGPLATNVAFNLSKLQGDEMQARLRTNRGQFRLIARAGENIVPDMGVVPANIVLVKKP